MIAALDYLHKAKVLHRDLKTSNIFITGAGKLKLGDFGIAKVLENSVQNAQTVVGTPYYMSPEICQNKPYSFKSDVWSLGCIVYELCALKRAFEASNLLSLVSKITEAEVEQIPTVYSKELSVLIHSMLIKNPDGRASLESIKASPIMKVYFQSQAINLKVDWSVAKKVNPLAECTFKTEFKETTFVTNQQRKGTAQQKPNVMISFSSKEDNRMDETFKTEVVAKQPSKPVDSDDELEVYESDDESAKKSPVDNGQSNRRRSKPLTNIENKLYSGKQFKS